MKKIYLLTILSLFMGLTMQSQIFNRTAQIGLQIETDTVLHPFDGNPTTSIGISGQVTFTSELGFVRFVVNDNYDDEYMIYESYRLFESDSTFSFSQKCDESCFFESYTPTELIVQVHDAIVTINCVNFGNTNYSNAEFLREQAAASSIEQKIIAVQKYINDNNLIWRAGHTSLSDLSYASKAKLWGKGFGSYGYEYYASGIFCHKGNVDPHDYYVDFYDYVDNFDWRNRHGANNEDSPYYDNDPNGTGWITPVVCQKGCWFDDTLVCGYNYAYLCEQAGGEFREAPSCWVFGPTAQVESMVNLYFNEHIDLDLSEQAILCRLKPTDTATVIPQGSSYNALNVYKNNGVPLEECLRYSASYNNCNDICENPSEIISISDHSSINNSYISVRQNLVQNGPLTASYIPYVWYQGNPPGNQTESHCMLLVGWGTIDKDTPSIIGVPYGFDSRWYGVTYWIYKNSVGPNHEHQGFEYIIHPKDVKIGNLRKIVTPIYSVCKTEEDVHCYDRDGDGYYFWGIGSKPSHCPPCPDEPDGDDNNVGLGPLNINGQCTVINLHNASFEHGWDNWIIPSCSRFDWNRKNDSCDFIFEDPQQPYSYQFHLKEAHDGEFYLYADGRSSIPPYEYCILESAPIDFENYCGGVLDFYLYQNSYIWGNPGDVKTEIQVSYDMGQTWINDYWYIEDSQGEGWHHEVITFPSSVNKIRIVGHPQRNPGWVLALDNITIKPMIFNSSPMVIDSFEEWEELTYIDQDVVIKNNGIVTIKAPISVQPNSKIIVKPGGRLVIDGGKLTSSCPNSMWPGIEVWGDKTAHQYPDANGNYAQGYVELKNGAVIENAECALALWRPGHWGTTGGIVHADNATFRNCAKAVHALHYTNHHPASGKETHYNSRFRNCTFTIDNGYLGTTDFHKHADLNHVDGISFTGCDFSTDRNAVGVSHYCMGIAAYQSGFSATAYCDHGNGNSAVYPCPDENLKGCSFSGFYRGIHASNNGSAARTFTVRNATFDNNTCGIYALNTGFATVIGCDFTVGCGPDCDFGILADHVTGFCIEENSFRPKHPGTGEPYGILIADSEGGNDIYRNTFSGLLCGNVAVGNNSQTAGNLQERTRNPGLTYTCNENEGNAFDFCILDDGPFSGIMPQQGSSALPAGNTFSDGRWHLHNDGDYQITYYYNSTDPNQAPDPAKLYNVATVATGNTNTCPSHYGGGSVVKSADEKAALAGVYAFASTANESLARIYANRIDGGSTPAETADINTATPSDLWRLRAKLLGHSPYLSQEALTAAADRHDVFPESVLFEILAANPDELKKDTLIRYMEQKESPLPQYMTDLLRQMASGTTARTALLAQMGHYAHERDLAAGDIVRSNLNDTLADHVELRAWLGSLDNLAADHLAVASFVQQGDFGSALALAESLPELYGLQGSGLDDHEDYMLLLGLYGTLDAEGRNTSQLTETEAAMVEGIANDGRGASRAMAEALLQSLSDDRVPESYCPTMPETTGGRGTAATPDPALLNKAMGFSASLSPNPATTWAAIDYTLPGGAAKATLTLTNALGVAVMTTELNGNQGQKVLDLRPLAAGVYGYALRCGEYVLNGKIIVTK